MSRNAPHESDSAEEALSYDGDRDYIAQTADQGTGKNRGSRWNPTGIRESPPCAIQVKPVQEAAPFGLGAWPAALVGPVREAVAQAPAILAGIRDNLRANARNVARQNLTMIEPMIEARAQSLAELATAQMVTGRVVTTSPLFAGVIATQGNLPRSMFSVITPYLLSRKMVW